MVGGDWGGREEAMDKKRDKAIHRAEAMTHAHVGGYMGWWSE